jgi:hypothetical protein
MPEVQKAEFKRPVSKPVTVNSVGVPVVDAVEKPKRVKPPTKSFSKLASTKKE